MRLLFTGILILFSHFAFNQNKEANNKDSLVKVLSAMDLEQFEKKKTHYFLSRVPSNYKVEISASSSLNSFYYPYVAVLKFPGRPYVEIHLLYEALAYTNPNHIFKRKIAKQLKRETIQKVRVYDEYLCVNGCDD